MSLLQALQAISSSGVATPSGQQRAKSLLVERNGMRGYVTSDGSFYQWQNKREPEPHEIEQIRQYHIQTGQFERRLQDLDGELVYLAPDGKRYPWEKSHLPKESDFDSLDEYARQLMADEQRDFTHRGKSGRVYNSDHPITPDERAQIDEYDAYHYPEQPKKKIGQRQPTKGEGQLVSQAAQAATGNVFAGLAMLGGTPAPAKKAFKKPPQSGQFLQNLVPETADDVFSKYRTPEAVEASAKKTLANAKKKPLASGVLSIPLVGDVRWVHRGPGFEAELPGVGTVRGGTRKQLMVNLSKAAKDKLEQDHTRAASPNLAAFIPSNDKAIPGNLQDPRTSAGQLLQTYGRINPGDRDKKEAFNRQVSEIGKAIAPYLGAVSPILGQSGPLSDLAGQVAASVITAPANIAYEIETIKSPDFTNEEKAGAVFNLAVAALTSSATPFGPSILDDAVRLMRGNPKGYMQAISKLDLRPEEKKAVQNFVFGEHQVASLTQPPKKRLQQTPAQPAPEIPKKRLQPETPPRRTHEPVQVEVGRVARISDQSFGKPGELAWTLKEVYEDSKQVQKKGPAGPVTKSGYQDVFPRIVERDGGYWAETGGQIQEADGVRIVVRPAFAEDFAPGVKFDHDKILRGLVPPKTERIKVNTQTRPGGTRMFERVKVSAEGQKFLETRMDPTDIEVYPGLQYKRAGITDPQNAITDDLKGVSKYDQATAGPLTVWETKDGRRFVMNGHHRRELAIRTGEPDVPVRVFREEDGVDFTTARAYGALQNVRDGKGTAIDAATVLRDLGASHEQLAQFGLNTKRGIARDAISLLKLSPESIKLVEDGVVRESVAAGIADAGLEQRRQLAAMKLAANSDLETRTQGAFLADRARIAPMVDRTGGSGDLFGELDESLALAEQAKLADNAMRRLSQSQRALQAFNRAKAVGSTFVDKEAQNQAAAIQEFGRKVLATDEQAANVLQQEAASYARNPTKQQLERSTAAIVQAAEEAAERRLQEIKPGSVAKGADDGLGGRTPSGQGQRVTTQPGESPKLPDIAIAKQGPVPIQDVWTGNIFREVSPDGLSDVNRPGSFWANDPSLAIGQGDNKGIVVEFKPSHGPRSYVRVNTSKPMFEFIWQRGMAEFVALENGYRLPGEVVGVRVKKGFKLDPVQQRRYNVAVQSGKWSKEITPEGDTLYRAANDSSSSRMSLEEPGESPTELFDIKPELTLEPDAVKNKSVKPKTESEPISREQLSFGETGDKKGQLGFFTDPDGTIRLNSGLGAQDILNTLKQMDDPSYRLGGPGTFTVTRNNPSSGYGLSERFRMPVSIIDGEGKTLQVGTYERLAGQLGKDASVAIKKAQSEIDTLSSQWERAIDVIEANLTPALKELARNSGLAYGLKSRPRMISKLIEIIESDFDNPLRKNLTPQLEKVLKMHDELTEYLRNYIIESRRGLGIETPDDWGITEQGYFRHLFLGDIRMIVDGEFVGTARTYAEAQRKALEIHRAMPQAEIQAVGRVVKGAEDVLRVSTKRYKKIAAGIADSVGVSMSDIMQDINGEIGQRAKKIKFFGALKQRTGAPGYSQDYVRVMRMHVAQVARTQELSKLNRELVPIAEKIREKGMPGVANAIMDHIDTIWGTPTSFERSVGDSIRKTPILRNHVGSPDFALRGLAIRLTKLQTALKLSYNVKSSFVNLLQPYSTLWPYVSTKDFAGLYGDLLKPETRKMLREKGIWEGDTKLEETTTGIKPKLKTPFRAASGMNRAMGYLYGYRTGIRKGMSEADAHRSGLAWAEKVEFDNSAWNGAPIFRSPQAKVLGQFKGFTLKNLEHFADAIRTREGDTTFTRAARIGKLTAAQLTVGGVKSLGVATQLFGGYKVAELLQAQFQQLGMSESDAKATATAIYYGAPSLIGQDLSASVAVLEPPYGHSPKDQILDFAFGPTVNTAVKVIEEAKNFSKAEDKQDKGGLSAATKRERALERAGRAITPYYKQAGALWRLIESEDGSTVLVLERAKSEKKTLAAKSGDYSGTEHIKLTPFESVMLVMGFSPVKQSIHFDSKKK